MPKVDCNGQSLHYADMGQMRALSRGNARFRCLALDNRDSGQSTYSEQRYTIGDLADDIACFLQALDLPAAHIVGISLGGMIAQEMALRHPQRVLSLFLMGTLARADGWFNATLDAYGHIRRQVENSCGFFVALLPWLVSHRFFENPERVEWLVAILKNHPHPQRIEGFFRQFEAMRGHDTLERLKDIACPVQVMVGEHDQICPPRYSQELATRIPQARLAVLPGVGHAPPIEDSRSFNRLLEAFLTSSRCLVR
jgi:3-oxoadipate enol-lactonase